MIIGIDLGGISAKAACLGGENLLGKSSCPTSSAHTPEETARHIASLAERTATLAGVSFSHIDGIGVGAPGVIDGERGAVVSWTNFGWRDVPLAALVSRFTGKPTFLLNDANAAALGEAKYGAGKRYESCVLVTLGTGVGSGIVFGGKLFEGYRGAGGEFGHMVIRQGGELCSCGRRGCFERYASTSSLVRRTREAMENHRDSLLWRFAPSPEQANGETVFSAKAAGDGCASEVLGGYFADLAEGIANIANALRPQAILIGGAISAQGDALIVPLRRAVEPLLYAPQSFAPLDLLCAALGNDAGLYGAAQYAQDRLGAGSVH